MIASSSSIDRSHRFFLGPIRSDRKSVELFFRKTDRKGCFGGGQKKWMCRLDGIATTRKTFEHPIESRPRKKWSRCFHNFGCLSFHKIAKNCHSISALELNFLFCKNKVITSNQTPTILALTNVFFFKNVNLCWFLTFVTDTGSVFLTKIPAVLVRSQNLLVPRSDPFF